MAIRDYAHLCTLKISLFRPPGCGELKDSLTQLHEWYHFSPSHKHLHDVAIVTCQTGSKMVSRVPESFGNLNQIWPLTQIQEFFQHDLKLG